MQRITADQWRRWQQIHAQQGDEYPFYTDEQMRRHDLKHVAEPLLENAAGLPPEVPAYLAATRSRERLDALRLHQLDRAIAELRQSGMTVREIMAQTGLRKWRIEKALRMVGRKLRAATHTEKSRTDGWQEVYLAETRRTGRA